MVCDVCPVVPYLILKDHHFSKVFLVKASMGEVSSDVGKHGW